MVNWGGNSLISTFLEQRNVGEHAANNFGPVLPFSLDTPPLELALFGFHFLSLSLCSLWISFHWFPRAEKKNVMPFTFIHFSD
jgi:hypothetical protein